MKKRLLLVVPMLFALVVASTAAQEEGTVDVLDDPALGSYLTDAEGRTLYRFENDSEGESTCYDQCAENWPPFTSEGPLVLPEDGVPGELTFIERDDGTQQVAYNGMPLYYFAQDDEVGDTTGHEVGGVWFVVNPSEPGATPAASPVASPVATPMS